MQNPKESLPAAEPWRTIEGSGKSLNAVEMRVVTVENTRQATLEGRDGSSGLSKRRDDNEAPATVPNEVN